MPIPRPVPGQAYTVLYEKHTLPPWGGVKPGLHWGKMCRLRNGLVGESRLFAEPGEVPWRGARLTTRKPAGRCPRALRFSGGARASAAALVIWVALWTAHRG